MPWEGCPGFNQAPIVAQKYRKNPTLCRSSPTRLGRSEGLEGKTHAADCNCKSSHAKRILEGDLIARNARMEPCAQKEASDLTESGTWVLRQPADGWIQETGETCVSPVFLGQAGQRKESLSVTDNPVQPAYFQHGVYLRHAGRQVVRVQESQVESPVSVGRLILRASVNPSTGRLLTIPKVNH
jgi:hypothetical protein